MSLVWARVFGVVMIVFSLVVGLLVGWRENNTLLLASAAVCVVLGMWTAIKPGDFLARRRAGQLRGRRRWGRDDHDDFPPRP